MAPEKVAVSGAFRSLIFDFQYSNHTGVIVYIRVMNGKASRHDRLIFKIAGREFEAIEVGVFKPDNTPVEALSAGEIGYIVTGIKEPGVASVGDTIASNKDALPPLPGYMSPRPVVWASLYPESQDDLPLLRQALGRLKLSDSSFTFEEEASGTLGKGYRCGFLGMLHLEIVTERLRREFNLNLVVTQPSITYTVETKDGKKSIVYSPALFPEDHEIKEVSEPIVTMKIITPPAYLSGLMKALFEHEAEVIGTENFGDNRTLLTLRMPLRELMRNFFDEIKSIFGLATLRFRMTSPRTASLTWSAWTSWSLTSRWPRLPAWSRAAVSLKKPKPWSRSSTRSCRANYLRSKSKLKLLVASSLQRPSQASKKDAAGTLSGGDITRKMKLREKQKGRSRKRLSRSMAMSSSLRRSS